MADVFTLDGSTLDLDANDAIPIRFSERLGSVPTLTLQRRGIALPGTPDPWVGKTLTWTHGGTLYFSGDVVSCSPSYGEAIGWVLTYQAMGLRNRLDWFPHTDSNSGIDVSTYNLQPEDPAYLPSRAGRNIGQILTDVLTTAGNGANLTAVGIGNLTFSGGAYSLPSATVSDLAALTVIPSRPVYFNGEKLGSGLDGFVQQWAPNHRMWVKPNGDIRILDIRTFATHTFTMGTDPIEPTELARDTGDCFQRVVIRGAPIATMALLKLSSSQITEQFAHDGLTTSAAKAAWVPSQWKAPGKAQDVGTCTCPSTTTITLTSSDATRAWASGYWDQSHQQGVINLSSTIVSDYTQFWSARIVSCPGLTAAGTCTVTIDAPLPHTSFDHYTISGLATGGSVVWTQYQVANTQLRPRVTNQSTYPQPFVNPSGGISLTSSAMGLVIRADGTTVPAPFTYNATTGMLRFLVPTYILANNASPTDIWVLLPIVTNPNSAIQPANTGSPPITPAYAGTSHTVDGWSNTLTMTMADWRDPGQLAQVVAYASDVLDSVKDAVTEGSITYYGFYANALTFGLAANVAGNDGAGAYTTGWESLAIPILEVAVEWPNAGPMDYRTTMHVSSRKSHGTAEMYLKPPRHEGFSFGVEDGFDPFNVALGGGLGGGIAFALPGDMGPGDMSRLGPQAQGPGSIDQAANMWRDHAALDPNLRGAEGTPDAAPMSNMGLPTGPGEYLKSMGAPDLSPSNPRLRAHEGFGEAAAAADDGGES